MTTKTTDIGPALARFIETSERLKKLLGEYGDLDRARTTPQRHITVFDRQVQISGRRERWDNDEESVRAVEFAKDIATSCRARIFHDAEAERAAKLREIADELTSIRGNLPAIAAAVTVELGGKAKDLRFEAEHGAQ